MSSFNSYFQSSIGRKQIVAVTGLLLIGFVIMHLAGNLFIFGGPEAFNGYAKKLASLRPALNYLEAALAAIFVVHLYVTALLVFENFNARGQRYAVQKSKAQKTWVARLMPYTGTAVFAFVIWHLLDFTFADHEGPRRILCGKDFGLYGIVYNSFKDPLHSLLYILAMIAVGMHLSHGVQSFCQTFGINHPRYTPIILKFSFWFSVLITLGYSSIPIFVFWDSLKTGPC